MQVDILFFSDKDSIKIKEIKNILSDIKGISVNLDTLNFGENDISYNLKLSTNKKYVYLVLELEGKNKANASVLSSVKNLIIKGEHRAGYKIVISYDESSMYFNEKLFSFISEHESRLRQLIYFILIDTFGSAWVQQTLNEKQQDELKNNLRSSKLIERGLEAFSYQDYISFLFDQRPNRFTNDFIDQAIEEIKLATDINKNKLLAFLKDNKSHSLWETTFSGIEYDEAEKDIRLIRDVRNGVMHNKEISTDKFDKNKKLIRKSTKGLDEAINYVKSEHSKDIKPDEVLFSLQETLTNIGTQYAALVKPMIDAVTAISESISKVYNFSGINVAQALQYNIKNVTQPFSTLYQNTELFDSIKAMQSMQQRYINSIPKIDIPEFDLPRIYFNPDLMRLDLPKSLIDPLVDEEVEDEIPENTEVDKDPDNIEKDTDSHDESET